MLLLWNFFLDHSFEILKLISFVNQILHDLGNLTW
jgi:hypothetical protein